MDGSADRGALSNPSRPHASSFDRNTEHEAPKSSIRHRKRGDDGDHDRVSTAGPGTIGGILMRRMITFAAASRYPAAQTDSTTCSTLHPRMRVRETVHVFSGIVRRARSTFVASRSSTAGR